MSNYTDIAWSAGFIDGEGTISLERHVPTAKNHPSPYFNVVLYATNTNKESLIKLQSLWGGSIAKHQKVRGHKLCWRWRLYGEKAISSVAIMLPYLVVKKNQANLVVSYKMRPKEKLTGKLYRLTGEERLYREDVVSQIRLLNKRGE